ncbi:hypothetical protein [Klebsiella pneumoniae]|uniref:hypothetical protein n=1 Tax=Klebsiella pneumoniae TaxID=573 RepID=UPI002265F8DA|nr:hypothetical protein [Klebsiella pneumoniae]
MGLIGGEHDFPIVELIAFRQIIDGVPAKCYRQRRFQPSRASVPESISVTSASGQFSPGD